MKIIKETDKYCIVETGLNAEDLQLILDNKVVPAKVFYTNIPNQKRVEYSSINYRTVMYYLDRL